MITVIVKKSQPSPILPLSRAIFSPQRYKSIICGGIRTNWRFRPFFQPQDDFRLLIGQKARRVISRGARRDEQRDHEGNQGRPRADFARRYLDPGHPESASIIAARDPRDTWPEIRRILAAAHEGLGLSLS